MNIKVYVRVRPPKEHEKTPPFGVSDQTVVTQKKQYTFDNVFSPDTSQKEFYYTALNGFISRVIDGFNCTFFAYGQTGTGKTYTMEGEENNEGVIPRVIDELFQTLEQRKLRYQMKVTHVEIYNEKVYDLLSDSRKELSIRDRKDGTGAAPDGATELTVTRDNVRQILSRSSSQRKTAATDLNPNSSRSHCIFTVIVQIIKDSVLDGDMVVPGRIHCVDLAGSENSKRAGVVGDRVKQQEGMAINQSLLALNRVIIGVSKGESYIPFRSSPLTRILQNALGGSNFTAMVATVSADSVDFDETVSTLEYANRVRTIKNSPKQNDSVKKDVFLQKKLDKIVDLKRLINDGKNHEKPLTEEELEQLHQEVARINQKNLEMQELFAQAKGEVATAKEQLKSALNYISLKRQNEIELKTVLRKVVSAVETLTQHSKDLEATLQNNTERLRMNESLIEEIKGNSVNTSQRVLEQTNSEYEEYKKCWESMKDSIHRCDRDSVTEGIKFEEYNQQCICKDALEQMKSFCAKGKEVQRTAIGIFNSIDHNKYNSQQDQQQRALDTVTRKNTDLCIEEVHASLGFVQSSQKDLEEAVAQREMDIVGRKRMMDEKENELMDIKKRTITDVSECFMSMEEDVSALVSQFQEKTLSYMNTWYEQEEEYENDVRRGQMELKDMTDSLCTKTLSDINAYSNSIDDYKQRREQITKEMTVELHRIIEEIKSTYDTYNQQAQSRKGEIKSLCQEFIVNSSSQIIGILQTIELGIGENGIIGVLKGQVDEIEKRMQKKVGIIEDVKRECEKVCEQFSATKKRLLDGVNSLNNTISIELYGLQRPSTQRVEVPQIVLKPKVSEQKVFGVRLSDKLKEIDNEL